MPMTCREVACEKFSGYLLVDEYCGFANIATLAKRFNYSVRYVHSVVREFEKAFRVEESYSGLVRDHVVHARRWKR